MSIRTNVLLIAVVAGLSAMPARAADNKADPAALPVSRAVLFSSGVGYFEHEGEIDGDSTMTLNFKTEQINDVLKSMILMDYGGGSVTSVTYPSNDPVERALRSFEVDISGNPTLADLLRQLRGARVSVATPNRIDGSILGVEPVTQVVGDPPTTITTWKLNLMTDAGIHSVKLEDLSGLRFEDEKLQAELNKALALLVSARDKDRKPIEIRFVGQGQRKVRVGYLVETPIWKTSYRLNLAGDKPLLQGWAIVENTSDIDWQGVSLALVSGRPISFVQDLYTPLYLPRPVVEPELYASLQPKRYEGGFGAVAKAAEADGLSRERVAGRRNLDRAAATATPMPAAAPPGRYSASGDVAFESIQMDAVQSVASAESVGELFSFQLKHPVDLSRRRSAMLPIVNQDVEAMKVSIYNQQVMAKHPLNGVRLNNTTGMKLMGGPITVFDGGAYAGDAQIGHLSPGDQRLLSYAIDLDVTVDPSVKHDSAMTGVKIVRGVLQVTRKHTFEQTYTIRNKAAVERAIVVEHPFNPSRTLVKPDKPAEKTSDLYRFDLAVGPDKTGKLEVVEEQVQREHIAILNTAAGSLVWYTQQGSVDPKVKQALTKAIEMKNALSELENTHRQREGELNEIKNGQDRLRRNIESVGAASQLGKRYITKLDEQETQIEKLEAALAELRDQIEAQRKALNDYLSDLDVG